MAIKTTKVQPVRVTYLCNTCESGEVVYSGRSFSNTFSTSFDHHCTKCGTPQTLDAIYPYIDYEEIKK